MVSHLQGQTIPTNMDFVVFILSGDRPMFGDCTLASLAGNPFDSHEH